MTLEQAKEIVKTWSLPLTKEEEATYKQALALVSAAAFKAPEESP